jgi:hypothetical protein
MKSQLIGVLVLVGASAGFSAGCVAQAQVSGTAEAEAPVAFVGTPTLVAVDSDVWVVSDADYATYYVDDYYWVYRDGSWYRSRAYDGGWVTIEVSVVPAVIVSRNHRAYVHYHGEATARTRPAPRGDGFASNARTEPAGGNPHGGPRGHEEMPGVGNQRKAEGEQPGNAHDSKRDGRGLVAPAEARDDRKEDKRVDKKEDKKEDKKKK